MDKLNAGQKLTAGQQLTSPNGKYTLTMQSDGNLVVYTKKDKAVWSSKTNGHQGASLALQDDRNLVLYPTSGPALWATATTVALTPVAAATPASMPGASTKATTSATMPAATGKAANATATRPTLERAVAANMGAAAASARSATSAAVKVGNRRTYTVARGDSLWRIAEKFYGDAEQYPKIAKANGIANPDMINVGQKLVIPD